MRYRALKLLVGLLWANRGRLAANVTWLWDLATALSTALTSTRAGRATVALYRWTMRLLAAGAILFAVIGVALIAGGNSARTVAGVIALGVAAYLGFQWWKWSAVLRFLRSRVDPARALPPEQVHAQLTALASDPEADVPPDVARELRRAADDLR